MNKYMCAAHYEQMKAKHLAVIIAYVTNQLSLDEFSLSRVYDVY